MDLKLGDTRLILEMCKQHGLLRNQAAYVLATARHETAHTMKPVRETLAKTDAGAIAALTKAWKNGKLPRVKKDYWSSGYFGRGYIQLTWEDNYRHAGEQLGLALATRPSLALEPDVAAEVIVQGMRDGWFAGDKAGRHKLSRYITLTKSDFTGARRIVNGTDRADLIAGYAKQYDALLKAEGYGDSSQPAPSNPAATENEADYQQEAGGSPWRNIFAEIIAAILRFFSKGK